MPALRRKDTRGALQVETPDWLEQVSDIQLSVILQPSLLPPEQTKS